MLNVAPDVSCRVVVQVVTIRKHQGQARFTLPNALVHSQLRDGDAMFKPWLYLRVVDPGEVRAVEGV